MKNVTASLKEVLKSKIQFEIKQIFEDKNFKNNLEIKNKYDNSIVTILDTKISNIVKEEVKKIIPYQNFVFYSEEEHNELSFPCVVLDPIDGTRELCQGLPECSISLAIMESPSLCDRRNWAWIYNPFTGFDIDSDQAFFPSINVQKNNLTGMVSRSEWEKGLYHNENSSILICPKGSIAFKLGLLAAGAIDFVISRRPKNIWDIAAGSILCQQRGIEMWADEKIIQSLNDKTYFPELVWGSESTLSILKSKKVL